VKFDWKAWAARIDDMSLRERAMLFASVAVVVVVLAYVTLIDRALVKQKQLVDRVNRDQTQVKAVRGQIESIVKENQAEVHSPDEVAIAELERRIAQTEKSFAEKQRAFIAPEQLPQLLGDILGRSPQLRVESLRLLPGTPLRAPGAAPAQARQQAQEEGASGVYRHGVEVTLKGSYLDLMQYLADLEKLPSALLWGRIELQVEHYPEVRLTLVVYTLSTRWSLLAT
jgi:MSHA biogenesis protein MshJ